MPDKKQSAETRIAQFVKESTKERPRCAVCRAAKQAPQLNDDLVEWIRVWESGEAGSGASWAKFTSWMKTEHGFKFRKDSLMQHAELCLGIRGEGSD